MPLAELLQLFSTFAVVGVIWTVQLLHYPAFSEIPADGFAPYHRRHTRRLVATNLATRDDVGDRCRVLSA